MLWDIIRDFFVVNIFGGSDSLGRVYGGSIGHAFTEDGNINFEIHNFGLKFDGFDLANETPITSISLGDYLSTTFTIITFVILFVVACLFVRWCFRVFKGALKW